MSAKVLALMLRDPGAIAAACREDRDVRDIAKTSLACIALGSAVFGGVVGSYRGGAQIAYAAAKIPVVLLATLAIAAPGFHAIAASLGRAWTMRSILSLTLAAAGRSALVLLALAPGVWLAFDWGVGYHSAALFAAMAYGLAGLAALGVLVRGLGPGSGRLMTAVGFIALFFAVGGQTSWALRPYLVRPRTKDVPLFRAREGGFADALFRSSRSAAGIYDIDSRVQVEGEEAPHESR